MPDRRSSARGQRPAPRLLALFAALCLLALAAACDGGSDVTIVAVDRQEAPTPEADEAATPDDRPVPVPAAPDNLLAGGTLVAGYLAGGEADLAGCLPELVDRWQLEPTEGLRCVTGDLDGDREAEFAFLVTAPDGAGDVWFFDDAQAGRRLISSARVLANAVLTEVALAAAGDLTGDREPDPVVTATACDGADCAPRLVVASGHLGALTDVTPDDLELTTIETVTVGDATGDGIDDLVIESGGADGDAPPTTGASPPRDTRLTLHWAGVSFFVRSEGAEGAYLVYALVDADRLYARGELAAARAAYEDAATDTSLLDWHAELGAGSDRTELVPYAFFRAALAAFRDGDPGGGERLLTRAISGHEASVHGEAAASFEVGITHSLSFEQSCEFATQALAARSVEFARAWDFGPEVTPPALSAICR